LEKEIFLTVERRTFLTAAFIISNLSEKRKYFIEKDMEFWYTDFCYEICGKQNHGTVQAIAKRNNGTWNFADWLVSQLPGNCMKKGTIYV